MESAAQTLPSISNTTTSVAATPGAGAAHRHARTGWALLDNHRLDGTPDEEALRRWLAIAAHRNSNTLRSYTSETSRFWCFLALMHAHNPSRPQSTLLRDATEADVAAYETTLLGKAPRTIWGRLLAPSYVLQACGLRDQPFLKTDIHLGEEASPSPGAQEGDGLAIKSLKSSSVNQALNILHALYAYWMIPDAQTRQSYVGANPVRRLKRATVRAQRQTKRIFPPQALHAMMQHVNALIATAENPKDKVAATRQRWLLCLLFGLWARRAEIASIRMGDFFYDGKGWRLNLTRKGGKEQDLPVAGWIMDAFMAYRSSLGISGFPEPSDLRPALMPMRLRNGTLDRQLDPTTLYREITRLAHAAAEQVKDERLLTDLSTWEREHVVQALEALSPHWFRHTAASMAIESGALSLENASRVLGHSSTVVTAAMYYHPDDKQVAEGLRKLGSMMSGDASPENAAATP